MPVGLFAITMMTSANGYVQTTTDPVMRGRVMALYMAIFMGGTPIGAPLVGWVANVAGPRWSMGVAAASGVLAAAHRPALDHPGPKAADPFRPQGPRDAALPLESDTAAGPAGRAGGAGNANGAARDRYPDDADDAVER